MLPRAAGPETAGPLASGSEMAELRTMDVRMEARDRANWIDWLKVLAVLGVFYYHTALIFSATRWLINNREYSLVLSGVAGFGYLFGMPLLFLLSGAASWYALRRRSAGNFAVLRFKRLVLPLAVGLVLLSPFQAYLSTASRGPAGSLPAFYLRFFEGIDLYGSPRWLSSYGYHLWFLGFLFAYSILALPLLSWLHRPAGQALMGWLADRCLRGFGLLWFVLPMLLVQVALRVRYPRLQDWADFAFWFVFFLSGYVLASDRRFAAAIARRGRTILITAILLTLPLLPLIALGWLWQLEGSPTYSLGTLGYLLLRSSLTWAWVLAILALGILKLRRSNRFLDYASEAVMPFYVLHHPVVVLVGFVVIGWPLGLWMKHGIVVALSLAVTVGLYEVLVRHTPLMRVLFGLHPHAAPSVPVDAPKPSSIAAQM